MTGSWICSLDLEIFWPDRTIQIVNSVRPDRWVEVQYSPR